METRIVKLEENVKSNQHRIDKTEEKIEKLEETYKIMEKMDYRMSNVEGTVTEIKNEIKSSLSDKGKKWDKLIDYIFYAILAYCLYKLGLK